MADRDWSSEYEHFLKYAIDRGDIDQGVFSHQRSHPRFRLKTSIVEVTIKHRFTGIDVSIGGISFFSSIPFQPGLIFQVGEPGKVIVDTEVTQCIFVEPMPGSQESRYRIHSKFKNEQDGMKFLIMMKESENLALAFI